MKVKIVAVEAPQQKQGKNGPYWKQSVFAELGKETREMSLFVEGPNQAYQPGAYEVPNDCLAVGDYNSPILRKFRLVPLAVAQQKAG